MKPFTGIFFLSILLICSACADENEPNHEGTTGCYDGTPLTVRALATGFENVSGSGNPSTRAFVKDEHLNREFTGSDTIGLFAVKDGAIIDNVDNTPLIFNVSNGSWNPGENGKTLYWYEGVSYVAYYPYRKNITIDASQDTEGIIASLAGNEKLQPAEDQSTAEKHAASDLMIATGVLDATNSSKIILNLQFRHQFTLLVLQPQAYVGCYAPKDAGFVYHVESRVLGTDSATTQVNLNGVTAYQIDSMKYCAIVPPRQDAQIAGNYMTTDGRENKETKINYSGGTTAFVSGKCYTLKVISPVPGKGSTVRKLYPGDFVFQNNTEGRIEIHPGDGKLEADGKIYDYEKAIGMVITCDSNKITEEERNNGWTHAYVMGLDSLGSGSWGEGPERDSDGKIIKDGVLEPIESITQSHGSVIVKNYMKGYSDTKTIIETRKEDASFAITYSTFNQIKKLQDEEEKEIPKNNGLPIRSPWFLPSIGQFIEFLINICGYDPTAQIPWDRYDYGGRMTLAAYNAQLAKVGKRSDYLVNNRRIFRSSTQVNANDSWILIWGVGVADGGTQDWDRIGIKYYDKTAAYLIYPFFAF